MRTNERWYVVVHSERKGPYSTEEVVQAALSGQLSESTYVVAEGDDQWTELGSTEPFKTLLRQRHAATPSSRETRRPSSSRIGVFLASLPSRLRAPTALGVPLIVIALLGAITWKTYRGNTHDPADVSKEMMLVLLDVAAIERAEVCSDDVQAVAAFQKGKPYEVASVAGDYCKVVSRGTPDSLIVGGFALTPFEDCTKLKTTLGKSLADHENDLDVKIRLYCDPQRKSAVDINDPSVKLAAEIRRQGQLSDVVARMNQGRISPAISHCYTQLKAQLITEQQQIKKLRCDVMSSDTKVARVTYSAIWARAQITDQLDDYQKEHKDLWEALSKQDKETAFYDKFTSEKQVDACTADESSTLAVEAVAARLAAATCM